MYRDYVMAIIYNKYADMKGYNELSATRRSRSEESTKACTWDCALQYPNVCFVEIICSVGNLARKIEHLDYIRQSTGAHWLAFNSPVGESVVI